MLIVLLYCNVVNVRANFQDLRKANKPQKREDAAYVLYS